MSKSHEVGKAGGLIAALAAAGQEELDELAEAIEARTHELDALKGAHKLIALKLNGKAQKNGWGGDSAGDSDDDLRQRIYDEISEAFGGGPVKAGVLGGRLGLSAQRVGKLVEHEWFVKSPQGISNA